MLRLVCSEWQDAFSPSSFSTNLLIHWVQILRFLAPSLVLVMRKSFISRLHRPGYSC